MKILKNENDTMPRWILFGEKRWDNDFFVKVLDTKISRLQSGFSSNSYGLPANIDWSSKIRYQHQCGDP
jgi:hypothetical protein